MSTQAKQSATPVATPSTSKFSIVRAICAALNLGDEGKLDSFLDKVVKQLKTEITVIKKNQDTREFMHDQNLSELEDKLADAKDALTESYLAVDVDKIQTKESQNSYIDVYLNKIDSKKKAVKFIEDQIKDAKEEFNKTTEDFNAEIASLEERLSVIVKA